MFSDREREEKKALFKLKERQFEENHIGFLGIVKDDGGDLNPSYRKDREELNNLRRELESDVRERERSSLKLGRVVPSLPRFSSSGSSGSSSFSGFLSVVYFVLGFVAIFIVIPLVLFTMFATWYYWLPTFLVWLLFIKFWIFPNVFTRYERWVTFIGMLTCTLCMLFVDNGSVTLKAVCIVLITIALLAVEVVLRVRENKKYKL